MKNFILGLIIASSVGTAHASFNRLWVGYKKKDITAAKFLNGLNETFFRDTINLGKGKGLLSYQPYITRMSTEVPDEIALVVYESEEKYRTLRSTPEGERYSAAHWDFFEKETSKSTVSVPFDGVLAENAAYELNPSAGSWQSGNTIVFIYQAGQESPESLARKFAARKKETGIRNAIVLFSGKLLIEYVSVTSPTIKPVPLSRVIESMGLPGRALAELKTPIGTEEGVNFRF